MTRKRDRRDRAADDSAPKVSDEAEPANPRGMSRRELLQRLGTGAAATAVSSAVGLGALGGATRDAEAAVEGTPFLDERFGPGPATVTLTVNGKPRAVTIDPRTTLLSALRDRLDLTGAKDVCGRGACGACTVHLDGKPVNACLMLALDARGRQIRTVEGLAVGDRLDPVQQAFVEKDALMCGFCTPGMVMAVRGLLDRKPNPTLDDVRHALAGNLCRCGAYPKIFEAALAAARATNGAATRATNGPVSRVPTKAPKGTTR